MYITRSLQASAFLLSFSTLTAALAVHRKPDGDADPEKRSGLTDFAHHGRLTGTLEKRQEQELNCPGDRWQELLDHNPEDRVATFCNEWLGLAPATKVVEETPTITITTSAASTTVTTSTTRFITTQTTTATATTTMQSVARRAANIASVGEQIIESVIASGTTSDTRTSTNEQRAQAEAGLATACSCRMVAPTATITSTFTVPPVSTTVGVRKVFIAQVTDTRVFTATTTVTIVAGQTVSASISSAFSTDLPSIPALADLSPSSAASESTTAPITPIAISRSVAPTGSSVDPSIPVVTAIPFSCPADAGKRIDQVVNGYRLDYLVLCDTELVTQDRIGRPISVESETSCTAQCSLVNAHGGPDTCQAASFQPYTDGRPGGTCTLTGSEPEYVDSPGSIAMVHTGSYSSGDECANLNSTGGPSISIDTSALIASITSASFSLSTPGLVTVSQDGGVSQTYVSANSTDASGYVHWSWYAVSASSSFWWAVYSTSWECTATISRTIVQQPAEPMTITSVLITTIITGSTTTIISGTSTRVFTNGGGGMIGPTFVPASTTEGNGEITTWFSLATQTSTGADGIIPPTAVPSGASIEVGSGNETVVFATSTFFSTGDAGVFPPSSGLPALPESSARFSDDAITVVSSGGALFTSSGSTFTSDLDESAGVIPPPSVTVVSSGGALFTSSGSTFTSDLDGSAGVIPPPSVTVVSSGGALFTSSGSTLTSDLDGSAGVIPPPSVTGGSAVFTSSGSTFTADSTGLSGIIIPIVPTYSTGASTLVSLSIQEVSETSSLPPVVVSATSGNASFSTSSSTFTFGSTGDSGIVPPVATDVPSTAVPSSTPSSDVEISVSGGTAELSTSSGTAVTSSTGASGGVPPSANVTITEISTVISSLAPTPGVNITIIGGTDGFSILESTATTSSTGDNGVIPPASSTDSTFTNSGADRTGGFSAATSSTDSTGIISPSSNSSVSTPTTGTPVASTNSSPTSIDSTFTNTDAPRTGGFSASTDSTASTGSTDVISPSSNSTSASATPVSSTNSSLTSTGSTFTNTDAPRTGGFSESTDSTVVTGNTGVISPSSNSSLSTPLSTTPGPNSSPTSTESTFTNTDAPRTGSFSAATVITESTGFIVPSSNSSVPTRSTGVVVPSSNSSVPNLSSTSPSSNSSPTSTGPTFTNTDAPRTGGFSAETVSTGSTGAIMPSSNSSASTVPSVTPSPSLNVSSVSTGPPLTDTEESQTPDVFTSKASNSTIPGTGTLPILATSTEVSTITVVIPTPSGNFTASIPPVFSSLGVPPVSANSTAPVVTLSSGIPTLSSNETTSAPTEILTVVPPPIGNSTASVVTPSSSIPTLSSNGTTSAPTEVITVVPPPIGNSTAPTGSSFTVQSVGNITSVPSATPSVSLNITTTSDVCPTVPVVVTVTSVATSVQILTTTLVETVTVCASSTLSDVLPVSTLVVPAEIDAPLRLRGIPATPEQVNTACADAENIILNPNFAIRDDGTVLGWAIDDQDPAITVGSEQAPAGNGTIAQFKSAVVGRTLTIIQPLTLCPDQQYELISLNRQAHAQAKCVVQYKVGDDEVFTVTPQESWLESSGFFTARQGVEGASVDLNITASCAGYAGLPVSDEEGWMRVEVSGISLVQDSAQSKQKMKRDVSQEVREQGFAALVWEK